MPSTFELPSAKNLSVDRAVEVFVPTELFWELLHSDSNDVLFGTRGSGKTMLLRMMSVQHLLQFSKTNAQARTALFADHRFAVFVPLGVDWCVAYQGHNTPSDDRLFVSGMNLVACDVLVGAVDALFRGFVLGLRDYDGEERGICRLLAELWFRKPVPSAQSFLALRRHLVNHQAVLADMWRKLEPPTDRVEARMGYSFRSNALFAPVVNAVKLINRHLNLPDRTRWLLCLDELEDLKPDQMRAVATALRAHHEELVFKITTLPYTLDSVDTDFSESSSAVEFRDYNVRRLQNDPHQPAYKKLVAEMLRKRMGKAVVDGLPKLVFGESTLAERAEATDAKFRETRQTISRSDALQRSDSARKKIPVAAIRSLRRAAEGNSRSIAYSGWSTVVALSDGNPGMFVRLMNELNVGPHTETVSPELQHRVATELANTWHEWSQALYTDGGVLHSLIAQVGEQLRDRLHGRKDKDEDVQEEVNRVVFDLSTLNQPNAEAFRAGARHGLLVGEAAGSSIRYPLAQGVWRLSYALAPKFWLLTRRGRITSFGERQLSLEFDRKSVADVQLGVDLAIEASFPTVDVVEEV